MVKLNDTVTPEYCTLVDTTVRENMSLMVAKHCATPTTHTKLKEMVESTCHQIRA